MTKRKDPFENDEAIKNLLIINLLKDGIDPKIIAIATGIPEMTIRARFPMKQLRPKKRIDEQTSAELHNSTTENGNTETKKAQKEGQSQ